MIRYAIAAVVLLLGCSSWDDARAANCSNYPYTLQNGQTADANQVMANFNNVLNCTNSNLLGAANNLSDVTSASTSRTNLGLGAAATEALGNNVIDDGSGNLYSKSSLHVQVFTTTGTFTVPTYITSSSVFKITSVGGGGGGGGVTGTNVAGGGGGSGGYGTGWFSGLTAGQTMAIGIGTAGTAGSSSGGTGGNGSATQVSAPNGTMIISSNGGGGGGGQTSTGTSLPGIHGSCTIAASTSGLTLAGAVTTGAQSGLPGVGLYFSGAGGGNPIGIAGGSTTAAGGTGTPASVGAGGSGAYSSSGSSPGVSGGTGEVIFEWVQ